MFGFIFFLHFLFISVQKMCKSTIKYVGQHIDFTNLIMNLKNKCKKKKKKKKIGLGLDVVKKTTTYVL